MPFLENYWELIGAGADAAVMLLLYKLYKSQVREAEVIKETPLYSVGPELENALRESPSNVLPYVCVEGVTKAVGKPLRSHYVEEEHGVIQHIIFVEHKAKRNQGYWSDIRRTIKDTFLVRPFQMANKSGSGKPVDVVDPMTSDYIKDSLTNTYDNYKAAEDSAFSRGIDRLFGEVTKGFQESEDMLGIGVPMLGIGKVVATGDKLNLEPPENGRYIITNLSKNQVVLSLKQSASWTKGFLWVFGIIGSGLVSYWLYRTIKRLLDKYRMQQFYAEIRQQREQQGRANNADTPEAPVENSCVVCLTNPREVVVLPCGHLCLCAECLMALPEPRRCPVCRGNITQHISVYNP